MLRFLSMFVFLAYASVAQAEGQLLLRLSHLVDGKPKQVISLYGTQIDPNVGSVNGQLWITVNGKRRTVPGDILSALAYERRGFSYDHFTKGIRDRQKQALCRLGGPAVGQILETRYLTYRNHRIVKSEMRPVLARAGNCLFDRDIAPKAQQAQIEATRAMAILETLGRLAR